jgi:membrane protease YdiL (CAAX protease family)
LRKIAGILAVFRDFLIEERFKFEVRWDIKNRISKCNGYIMTFFRNSSESSEKSSTIMRVGMVVSQALSRLLNSTIVLIIIALALFYCNFQATVIYSAIFGHLPNLKQVLPFFLFVIYTLGGYLLLPAFISKFLYKKNLQEIGLSLPNNKKMTIILTSSALIIMLPMILYFSTLKQFQSYYFWGHTSLIQFIIIQFVLVPFYYFAEEFFFRGFLFINLWNRVGWHSFWISEIIFTYAHLGKPWLEVILSIPASIVLNYLVLKTRSIFPSMLVHYSMGVLLNVLINYQLFKNTLLLLH